MSIRQIVAVVFVFLLASAGWFVLGTATAARSGQFSKRLGTQVQALWGTPLVQTAPSLSVTIPGTDQVRPIMPARNEISAQLTLDYRRKGLIWYPTYVCRFEGAYGIANSETVTQKVLFRFAFPTPDGTYDEFSASLDGKPVSLSVRPDEGIREILEIPPGGTREVRIAYVTRGLGEWRYRIDRAVGRVQNLKATVVTDFVNVDYPEGGLSPMSATPSGTGRTLVWTASDLITTQDLGVVVPDRLNPGPIASRIAFFAPVCLLFFFVLLAAIHLVRHVAIHPMHYLFVAAGFFAFHLLFAYLVDQVSVHVAFLIAAVTTVLLVTLYLAGALGRDFPWKTAALGQLFYLVLFSYSFFWTGMTGLTVTIASVLTLAVLMRVTARFDWGAVFGADRVQEEARDVSTPPAPPPLPTAR